jgi:hypothetical protein
MSKIIRFKLEKQQIYISNKTVFCNDDGLREMFLRLLMISRVKCKDKSKALLFFFNEYLQEFEITDIGIEEF